MKIIDEAKQEIIEKNKTLLMDVLKNRNSTCPITGRQICSITGIRNSVAVRALVNVLRMEEVPIASCEDGYFLAHYSYELVDTLQHLNGRIVGIQNAIDGLTRAREQMIAHADPDASSETDLDFDVSELLK